MFAVNLEDLPLKETWTEVNDLQRVRSTFPFIGSEENKDTSVVHFELEPGHELGTHTDSAEEILLILKGHVEVVVADETAEVEGPGLALVPRMEPHNLRNIGDEIVSVIGFFPSRYLVATFENKWLPDETHVIDTEAIEEYVLEEQEA